MRKNIEDYTRVSEILSIFQAYSFVDPKRLKKAQDIGTNIHAAIESYFKDEFIPLDARKAPYFESFLTWADSLHALPLSTETRLYDHSLMLTGQYDLIASVSEDLFLIDFKTGSWAHPEIWELQMHFYRHLLEVNELCTPDKFMIVQLQKDGTPPILFESSYSKDSLNTCMKALDCYRWLKKEVVLN